MAGKFTLSQLLPELQSVIENKKTVSNAMNVQEAYFLMQACQLIAIHSKLGNQMKDRFIALGRRMQELVRPHVSANFAEFMEAGWHREFDE
jgi:hypothetical protein